MNHEIVVEKLVKRYGTFEAVKGVSFQVASGEIFGFLGPNGAGKSTVVKILTTLARPTSGTALIGGFNIASEAAQIRRVTGVALQEVGLDPLMKSRELLILQGRMFGRTSRQAAARAEELLELVKLTDPKTQSRRVGQYSGGMRRRLDLALALVHEPRILFLDEPTTGLDPASRRDIWAEVRRLNAELGMTIFLTTQYLEEADEFADRVAIINGGALVAEGTPRALKAQIGSEAINVTFRNAEDVQRGKSVLADLSTAPTQTDGSTLRLYLNNAAAAVAVVANRLQTAGLEMTLLTLSQPTLDDVFLEVTGQRLAVDDAKRSFEQTQPIST
ncbi:MAG: ATP-binding cassette domain-containing protein [Pleurocapsa minor GSE-CHR-MK-17-07R]|nr:ATP-binding cassette domain-containing protein [Pleurocapsa minor GSE-CHR-MK 17-07R]